MLLASKRLAFLVLGAAVIAFAVPTATSVPPGDFHTGPTLICSQCHVMHGQQSHGYNPDGSGFFLPVGAGGPFTYLLRDEINNLCLACHDGSSIAPDVLDVNTGKYPGDIRLAGYLNREGVIGLAPTGHTLDTTDPAPGSDPVWSPDPVTGFVCTDCHQQHGYGGPGDFNQYRNLVADPGNVNAFVTGGVEVNYATGVNDLQKDVFQRSIFDYDRANVDYNEPVNTESAYAEWCKGCHTNFHGLVGGPEVGGSGTPATHFVRHPNAGVDIGAAGGGHSSLGVFAGNTNKVKVMSETGVWDGSVGDITPSCFSCHKSHGNGNAFGLIYMSGTGTITENGDDGTTAKDLCGQCHVQGG